LSLVKFGCSNEVKLLNRSTLATSASHAATDPRAANTLGTMIAVVVSLKVKPDLRDKFLAAAEDDSICSPRDEPGCLRFDVLQDQADENHFFFYEVYRDEGAVQAHSQTPHYARWSAARNEVLAEPPVRTATTTLFPRDYR
jgi:autoinducer 2-degrading protein